MVEQKATLILQLKDLASRGLASAGTSLQRLGKWVEANRFQFLALGAGIGLLGKKMIDAADKMEQWSISFETMIGNAGQARNLMEEIKKFAKETPFELPDVIKGAKGLLAFGIELENVLPNLKMLGDVSAGLGVPMERLILNFGQVKAQTKLTGRELRDFAIAGVPLLAELAKNLNMTEAEIQDMVSKGKIGFAEVEKAFKTMSGEGGRFNNLMQRQMQTFTGVVSNLQDSIFQLSAELGEVLLPTAKQVVERFMEMTESIKENKNTYATIIEAVVYWGQTIVEVFTFVGEFLGTWFATIYEQFHGLYQILTGDFVEGINTMTSSAQIGFETVQNDFMKMVDNIDRASKKSHKKQQKDDKVHKTIMAKQELQQKTDLLKYAEMFAKSDKELKDKIEKEDEERRQLRNKRVMDALNYISSLQTAKTKELAIVGKAAGIAQATVDTFVAATSAMKVPPPPVGMALAAAVTAAGLANVARISGVELAEGGVVLPRQGGVQAIMAEAGKAEAVIPLDDEEAQEKLGGIGGGNVTINMNIGTLVSDDNTLTELAEKIDEKLYELQRSRNTVSF